MATLRKGHVVRDVWDAHYEVTGVNADGTLSLMSVNTKSTYVNVPQADVEHVPGLTHRQ